MSATPSLSIPRWEIGNVFSDMVDWMTENWGTFFEQIDIWVERLVNALSDVLTAPNPLIMIVIFAALPFAVMRWDGWKLSLFTLIAMTLTAGFGQWENSMNSLSLILVASVIAVIIALPLGILAGRSDIASAIMRPLMDLMQTMPAFVYLIPVVMFFSIGVVPGVIATVVFAMPPGVRLTELGIRNVDAELVEAGHAFGSTPFTILRRIQLPLALPTILAGINQIIMLALSMVVIAGMVGAGGLGGAVFEAITQLNIGLGFEAGLAVVALAIYLDRLTGALGARFTRQ